MPLLQGLPFKLVQPIEKTSPNCEIFTIEHTGEQFLSRGEYGDRLALYSQNIWTCQCTGRSGLTHQEAWKSEAQIRVAATAAIAAPLHKPLLSLIHHSLSPLEQLVDSASMLCYSQYHTGEELMYIGAKPCHVKVVKVSEYPRNKQEPNGSHSDPVVGNGVGDSQVEVVNGSSNGVVEASQSVSPGKENETNSSQFGREESSRKEMLPRLYTVIRSEDQAVIEKVLSHQLQRTYKVPSKDQIRQFIRSCAMRYRGATCTPWVVSEDLIAKHSIQNKLPQMFLSPKNVSNSSKRKSIPSTQEQKRPKLEKKTSFQQSNVSQASSSVGAPTNTLQILPKLNQALTKASRAPKKEDKVPKKRGRPPLTKEEKERNKKIRQQTLIDLANKMGSQPKPDGASENAEKPEAPAIPKLIPSTTITTPSTYKSPIKRATTVEALMKLPLMRRLVHEYKTIKGVMGQYRRMAYTMDLVLTKLSPMQIEMIPDENLRNDLYIRQKKVAAKKLMENMTPDERKEYMKKKARAIALERWKERKLKNLKIEDKTLKDLKPLPAPVLVQTPKSLPNYLFGEVVMITEFLKCYRDLLFGEEKFKLTTTQLIEAMCNGLAGYQVIADIICCLLPTIILDETSKNFKELGMPLSSIPINYQTAAELTRLCLKKVESEDNTSTESDEYEEVGREETELSDNLLDQLEKKELWQLCPHEILSILQALVHKTLVCSSLSVYMEDMDDKASIAFREKRVILRKLQKEKYEESQKRRDERRKSKADKPKKQRGRPKGYSPKLGGTIQEFYAKMKQAKEPEKPMVNAVLNRRKSAENVKKEKALAEQLEKERLKQLEDEQKKRAAERKYDEVVAKRDDLLRRVPLGYDRHHNRYWIFHSSTPGLYMEKGWIDPSTNCQFILNEKEAGDWSEPVHLPTSPIKKERPLIKEEDLCIKDEPEENQLNGLSQNSVKSEPESEVKTSQSESISEDRLEIDEDHPLSIVEPKSDPEDEKPLSVIQSKLGDDDDRKPLSSVKSKLTLSPMKMTSRGRPPKEAYILVDEDTQTFPKVEVNTWYHYESMGDVKALIESLSDKGQRESQLMASLNLQKERLQYQYNLKAEDLKLPEEPVDAIKQSLKEDVVQIERELTEGWLGSIMKFDEWEAKMQKADTVPEVGELLIEVQKNMQLKFLKGLMAPSKKQIPNDNPEAPPEFEEIEGGGVLKWREAVRSSNTFSRLHVLVGLFDSSIKWERSMATRKCKICRSKQKEDPLLMCDKCESSYHMYCLRPPLKEDVVEPWLCPSCVPKKQRREEVQVIVAEDDDPEEKEDPTFSLSKRERACKKKVKPAPCEPSEKKQDQSCCVCAGRIGLIVCSRCTTAYHSECHEPPLESRARKDWVCASCKNPRARSRPRPDPTAVRRNIFGALDEVTARSSGSRAKKAEPNPEPTKTIESSKTTENGARSSRSARARVVSKAKVSTSRRSGRTLKRPRSYKYESEEEKSSVEGSEDESPPSRNQKRPRRNAVQKRVVESESEVSEGSEQEEEGPYNDQTEETFDEDPVGYDSKNSDIEESIHSDEDDEAEGTMEMSEDES